MKTITIFVALVVNATVSAQCFQKVISGNNYYLAISQDGTLWGWGENSNSQLGDGSAIDRTTPVQISTSTWQQVSGGTLHSAGIKSDGTLWTWGSDSGGRLGNGVSGSSTFPMQIGTDTNWKEVYAGEIATVAIKTNGTIWSWGTNTGLFLGTGQATGYVSQVPVQIGTDTDWNILFAKGWSCFAIKNSGALWAWGENSLGQLGNGLNLDVATPTQIGTATNWSKISSNERLTFAIKTDHTLWGWGTQTGGAGSTYLGINAIYTPLQIGSATDWESVSVKPISTYDYVMLLKSNHTLWAWGSDTYEQLGNGIVNSNYTVATQIGTESDWASTTAGSGQTFAVKQNGTFWAWGATALVGSGTGNTDIPTQYACTSLGNEDFEANTYAIYPNPVSDKLSITSTDDVISLKIFDLNSRKFEIVLTENFLDVSGLAQGVYLLSIETAKGITTKKFVKK